MTRGPPWCAPVHRSLPSRLAFFAVWAVVALASDAWQIEALAQPATTMARTSVGGGVTVSVTLGRFTSSEWMFKVVLDTHTQALDDDLLKTAVLMVDGIELHPAIWSAPPSAHHREAILVFSAPSRRPAKVELRITRSNEPQPRVFRWDGGSLL